uniref:Replicase n=1 Tax=Agaricus bisporus virus 13 TaxID=1945743 RepID=A0A1Q1N6J5_9VIRU|nr:replicase [Agaricus bisporus virus 13]
MEHGVIVTHQPLIPKVKDDYQGWVDKASKYIVQELLVEKKVELAVPELAAPLYRAPYDAFRGTHDFDPMVHQFGQRLNGLAKVPVGAFNGKLIGDPTETRKNARGNYVAPRLVEKFGTGLNLQYDTQDALGNYATLAERYCCNKKNYVLDESARTLARQIAEHAFAELIDPEKLRQAAHDIKAGTVYQDWLRKAKDAAYAASHDLFSEESDRIVRYHGKAITKAKSEITFDGVFKVGQGISAWSKGANSFFGAACRIGAQLQTASFRDEVVFNNGMSEEEAVGRFMKAASKLPTFEGVTLDVTQMDSRINGFIFAILAAFDKLCLLDEEFVDLYYSMCEDYQMMSEEVKMVLSWVMTSGAPWTLKGNTNVVGILECWLFQGEGPWARFWQGDDGRRNQAKLRLRRDRAEQLALYTGFEMKMEFSMFGDLCGFIFSHGLVVPSIRRKLVKLIGTEFSSADHFYQYQISLRQWCDKINGALCNSDIFTINAENNGVSEFTVEEWYATISSVSHLSYAQFSELAVRIRKEQHFLNARGHLETV